MRRTAVSLSIATAIVALAGTVVPAQAAPLPSETVIKGLLLTAGPLASSTGYTGALTPAGAPSCTRTDDGGLDCVFAVAPADWDNPNDYPYMAIISGFPTVAAARKHWTNHSSKPTPWNNETITIVTKSKSEVTYTSVPADPAQMASAWTSLMGKQGIIMAACSANTVTPNLAKLAECARKAAKAQLAKVRAARPKTSLA